MKIKKGDTVKVLVGKDTGRSGRVLTVLSKQDAVVVDGLNVFKKHVKGDSRLKKSAIIDIAKPLHISNVMLICPACSKPSRVVMKNVDGSFVRICRKCGKSVEIRKSVVAEQKNGKKSETKGDKRPQKDETPSAKTKGKE
jgi:large subunit ribosomal protein L24